MWLNINANLRVSRCTRPRYWSGQLVERASCLLKTLELVLRLTDAIYKYKSSQRSHLKLCSSFLSFITSRILSNSAVASLYSCCTLSVFTMIFQRFTFALLLAISVVSAQSVVVTTV
jgi:hypothetical protein